MSVPAEMVTTFEKVKRRRASASRISLTLNETRNRREGNTFPLP